VYLDIIKEWLDSGGQKMIAKLAPRMTVGEAIRILAQVFTQDFGEVKKQFDQLVAETPARKTPAQAQITAAQDITDIGAATQDSNAATAGIITSAIISPQDVGGIDLNPNLLELQIEGNGLELNIPVNNPNIEHIRIEGLLPVIINVTPITNLPVILGAVETETELYAAARE
ncbi:MAG: hypothetical protein K8I00_06815, partial [Candidatus Omnitrophica bacterium]|nr:hypothetical protein [Candidatus Omnitrophota bacterium]